MAEPTIYQEILGVMRPLAKVLHYRVEDGPQPVIATLKDVCDRAASEITVLIRLNVERREAIEAQSKKMETYGSKIKERNEKLEVILAAARRLIHLERTALQHGRASHALINLEKAVLSVQEKEDGKDT
jgi:hypothetical protein